LGTARVWRPTRKPTTKRVVEASEEGRCSSAAVTARTSAKEVAVSRMRPVEGSWGPERAMRTPAEASRGQ
jgi:hypothetical protein